MKEKAKIFLLLVIGLFLCFGGIDKASAMTTEDFEDLDSPQMYIIGSYIFDIYNYNPTIKDLMTAARTIEGDEVEIIQVFKIGDLLQVANVFGGDLIENEDFLENYLDNITTLVSASEGSKTTQIYNYTVKFYDGSSLLSSSLVAAGGTVARPTDPVKTGYIFEGWRLNGLSYQFSTPVRNSFSLFAYWDHKVYNIIFNDNVLDEVIPVPTQISKVYGENIGIGANATPERTGYDFLGWSTQNDATTGTYTDTINSELTEDVTDQTLYAIWKIKQWDVLYNGNGDGASSLPENQVKIYGQPLTLQSELVPTRTGYNFVGWNTKSDGSGTSYNLGGSYIVNDRVTLYAKWALKTYTVTYNVNGGDTNSAPENGTKTHGEDLTLSEIVPTKENYVFDSWNTKSDGTGDRYAKGSPYENNDNLNLYAKWDEARTVTFDLNGVERSEQVAYNEVINVGDIEDYNSYTSLSGNKFEGWFTNVSKLDPMCMDEQNYHLDFGQYGEGEEIYYCNGRGDVIAPFNISTEVITDDITLYGFFTEIPFTIHYVLNNETNETIADDNVSRRDSIELPDDSEMTTPTDINGNSAHFFGWSTVKDECTDQFGNLCIINLGDNPMILAGFDLHTDITLYALWDYDAINIHYVHQSQCDNISGNCQNTEMFSDTLEKNTEYTFRTGDINYDTDVTLNDHATANNLLLTGWSLDQNIYQQDSIFELGNKITISNDDTLFSKDMNLYPVLIYKVMDVTYDLNGTNDILGVVNDGGTIESSTATFNQPFTATSKVIGNPIDPEGFMWYGWETFDDLNRRFFLKKNLITEAGITENHSTIENFDYAKLYVDYEEDDAPHIGVQFNPVFVPDWFDDLVDEEQPDAKSATINSSDEFRAFISVISELATVNKEFNIVVNADLSYIGNIDIPSNVTLVMGLSNGNPVNPIISGEVNVYGTLVLNPVLTDSYSLLMTTVGEGRILVLYGGKILIKDAAGNIEYIGDTDDSKIRMRDVCSDVAECFNTLVELKQDGMMQGIFVITGAIEINNPNSDRFDDAFFLRLNEFLNISDQSTVYVNIPLVVSGDVEGVGTVEIADDAGVYLDSYGELENLYGSFTPNLVDSENEARVYRTPIIVSYLPGTTDPVNNMPLEGTATLGQNYQISNSVPTRENYEFSGWDTNDDGNIDLNHGETIPNIEISVNLVALWTPVQ